MDRSASSTSWFDEPVVSAITIFAPSAGTLAGFQFVAVPQSLLVVPLQVPWAWAAAGSTAAASASGWIFFMALMGGW
jgi:hypothetical protein